MDGLDEVADNRRVRRGKKKRLAKQAGKDQKKRKSAKSPKSDRMRYKGMPRTSRKVGAIVLGVTLFAIAAIITGAAWPYITDADTEWEQWQSLTCDQKRAELETIQYREPWQYADYQATC